MPAFKIYPFLPFSGLAIYLPLLSYPQSVTRSLISCSIILPTSFFPMVFIGGSRAHTEHPNSLPWHSGPSTSPKSLSHSYLPFKILPLETNLYQELPLTLCSYSVSAIICLNLIVLPKIQLKAHIPWITWVNSGCFFIHTSICNS